MTEEEIKNSTVYKQLEAGRNYYKTEWEMLARECEALEKHIKQQDKEIKELEEIIRNEH